MLVLVECAPLGAWNDDDDEAVVDTRVDGPDQAEDSRTEEEVDTHNTDHPRGSDTRFVRDVEAGEACRSTNRTDDVDSLRSNHRMDVEQMTLKHFDWAPPCASSTILQPRPPA